MKSERAINECLRESMEEVKNRFELEHLGIGEVEAREIYFNQFLALPKALRENKTVHFNGLGKFYPYSKNPKHLKYNTDKAKENNIVVRNQSVKRLAKETKDYKLADDDTKGRNKKVVAIVNSDFFSLKRKLNE